jgi:hypothetical protein
MRERASRGLLGNLQVPSAREAARSWTVDQRLPGRHCFSGFFYGGFT